MEVLVSRITEILVHQFEISADVITPDRVFTELDLDSLNLIELALSIELEFGVPISEDELLRAQTVVEVAALLQGKGVGVG